METHFCDRLRSCDRDRRRSQKIEPCSINIVTSYHVILLFFHLILIFSLHCQLFFTYFRYYKICNIRITYQCKILIVPEEGWFGQPKYSTPSKKPQLLLIRCQTLVFEGYGVEPRTCTFVSGLLCEMQQFRVEGCIDALDFGLCIICLECPQVSP